MTRCGLFSSMLVCLVGLVLVVVGALHAETITRPDPASPGRLEIQSACPLTQHCGKLILGQTETDQLLVRLPRPAAAALVHDIRWRRLLRPAGHPPAHHPLLRILAPALLPGITLTSAEDCQEKSGLLSEC